MHQLTVRVTSDQLQVIEQWQALKSLPSRAAATRDLLDQALRPARVVVAGDSAGVSVKRTEGQNRAYQVLAGRLARARNAPKADVKKLILSEASAQFGREIEDSKTLSQAEASWCIDRLDALRRIPAAVRFISAEPLLGNLVCSDCGGTGYESAAREGPCDECEGGYGTLDLDGIDWVIVGGESGPKARPMHPTWVEEIRQLCMSTVHIDNGRRGRGPQTFSRPAFFFKQWGEWAPSTHYTGSWGEPKAYTFTEGGMAYRVGKKRAGRLLDGREWNEMTARAEVSA